MKDGTKKIGRSVVVILVVIILFFAGLWIVSKQQEMKFQPSRDQAPKTLWQMITHQ